METTKISKKGQSNPKASLIVLGDLPKHPVPKGSHSRLIVQGEVQKPLSIPLGQLRSMPTVKLSEDFKCLEGWVVKDVLWEGVPLRSVLQIAGLKKKSAKFLLFSSGEYTSAMNIRKASRITTLLALKKSGRWLTRSNGGPIRLVFEGHNCYESVKRVNEITVMKNKPRDTARKIAVSRIRED